MNKEEIAKKYGAKKTNSDIASKYGAKPVSEKTEYKPLPSSPDGGGGFFSNAYKSYSKTLSDLSTGAVQGMLSTGRNIGKGLQASGQYILAGITPGKTYEDIRKETGLKSLKDETVEGQSVIESLRPKNTAQKVGYGAEQLAEFFVPGGTISKGEKALSAYLKGSSALSPFSQGLIKTGAGALAEGLGATAVSTAQGKDSDELAKTFALSSALSVPFKAFSAFREPAKEILEKSAEKGISRSLGATTKLNKELSKKIAPELAKRKEFIFTRNSFMDKAGKKVSELGDEIDELWGKVSPETKTVVSPILNELDDFKSSFVVKGTKTIPEAAKESYRAVEQLQKDIIETAGGTGDDLVKKIVSNHLQEAQDVVDNIPDMVNANKQEFFQRVKTNIVDGLRGDGFKADADILDEAINVGRFNSLDELKNALNEKLSNMGQISYESLRSFRQILDKTIEKSGKGFGLTGSESAVLAASKAGANAMRTQIAKEFPDIAAINKEFNFWKNVEKVLGDTVTKTTGQSVPLGQQLIEAAVVGGGVAQKSGFIRTIANAVFFGQLKKAIQSSAWRSTSSIFKMTLADLISSGNFEKATELLNRSILGTVNKE